MKKGPWNRILLIVWTSINIYIGWVGKGLLWSVLLIGFFTSAFSMGFFQSVLEIWVFRSGLQRVARASSIGFGIGLVDSVLSNGLFR